MASKAFYRSKKGRHVFPITDILGRAQRALERGVPIGRGHALEIKQEAGLPTLLPNWFHHDVTTSIRDAMTLYPPMPIPRSMVSGAWPASSRSSKQDKVFPIERLLEKFLKRHPEVVWKVPNSSGRDWAPTLFCRRQNELMQRGLDGKRGMSEEMAYQQVVLEGGGGGDWHGAELEHDQLKRVLKKTAAFTENKFSMPGMLDGYSLVREYRRLKDLESRSSKFSASSKSAAGAGAGAAQRSPANKFLNEAEELLQEREGKRREFDYKVLAKMRNVSLQLPSEEPSWVEAALDLKGTRYEMYNLKHKIITQLYAEREAKELAELAGEEYDVPTHLYGQDVDSDSHSSAAHPDAEVKHEVFLSNLPSDSTEADVLAYFATLGVTPKRVGMGTDPATKACKGYAFAQFENDDELSLALKTNTFQLRGKLVKMRLSIPKF